MLTIEVFRPDEMALDLKEKENAKMKKQLDNPYIIEEQDFEEGLLEGKKD
jgi:hypothetical protein